ncbi:MAG TPA: transporter [Kofleriaceae bacterium]|nr:transporter [Kofleriaceae bacterium]
MRITQVIGIMVALANASPAIADHFVGAPAPERTVTRSLGPETSVNVEASTTSFTEGDFEGTFCTLAARGEYRWRSLGFHLRVPVHTLSMNDRDRATGLGDVVVGATWIGLRRPRLSVGVGVDGYLPSGDSEQGLGQGNVAAGITAHAAMTLPRGSRLTATLGALAGDAAEGEALFVEQRADAELRAGLGLSMQLERVRFGGRTNAVLPLAPGAARGAFMLTAGPALAIDLTRRLWADVFADLPLLSDRRFDWQAGISIGYVFDAGDPERQPTTTRPDASLRSVGR